MKLRHIKIENFRQVASWEHRFTDSLGRVRDVTLLVGPNGSGKTSILDAIAAAFYPLTHVDALRQGLEMSLKRIVRHGAMFAQVEGEVEFSLPEIEAALEVSRIHQEQVREFPRGPIRQGSHPPRQESHTQEEAIRNSSVVSFRWTYPDPSGTREAGRVECQPREGASIFRTRSRAARLLATQRLRTMRQLESAGAVFTFDQQRAMIGRTIPRPIWEVLANACSLPEPASNGSAPGGRRTTDPRLLLLSMAIQDHFPSRPGAADEPSDFARVREAYHRICQPRDLVGAVRDDLDRFDIEFSSGDARYGYGDLSSGEQMVLLLLIRVVSERMHRSLLLVDEVELHQHPIWQRRILDDLKRMGIDNQIIATTHSDYLRDVMPPAGVVVLGDVGGRGPKGG